MTAAVLLPGRLVEQGLRRTDPRRDLGAVGELLGTAFGSELDASGRRMVRDMKRYGKHGWLGWIAAQFLIPTATFPRGFVWMEDGHLVGNAHVLRVPGFPRRWVAANVAVHPDFQRRGIARSLMEACIEEIRQRGGTEVYLQVRERNQGARMLYETLNFCVLSTRTDWICPRNPQPYSLQKDPVIRPRRRNEWRQQAALASSQFPEGLIWPTPSIESYFKPANLAGALGLDYRNHWVTVDQGRIIGSISLVSQPDLSSMYLILTAAADYRGKLETGLLSYVLQQIGPIRKPVMLNYPAGIADEDIARLGFVPKNTLHWMRLVL
jgi:ribosomal protein S18 acetylase RimI-like enzyme